MGSETPLARFLGQYDAMPIVTDDHCYKVRKMVWLSTKHIPLQYLMIGSGMDLRNAPECYALLL